MLFAKDAGSDLIKPSIVFALLGRNLEGGGNEDIMWDDMAFRRFFHLPTFKFNFSYEECEGSAEVHFKSKNSCEIHYKLTVKLSQQNVHVPLKKLEIDETVRVSQFEYITNNRISAMVDGRLYKNFPIISSDGTFTVLIEVRMSRHYLLVLLGMCEKDHL